MRVSESFAVYFKASDFVAPRTMTIEKVAVVNFKDGRKMVVKFVDEVRLLVLNKTNAFTLSDAFGDETDHWIGKKIQLGTTDVFYNGQVVTGICVSSISSLQNGFLHRVSNVANVPHQPQTRKEITSQLPPEYDMPAPVKPDSKHGSSNKNNIKAPGLDFQD